MYFYVEPLTQVKKKLHCLNANIMFNQESGLCKHRLLEERMLFLQRLLSVWLVANWESRACPLPYVWELWNREEGRQTHREENWRMGVRNTEILCVYHRGKPRGIYGLYRRVKKKYRWTLEIEAQRKRTKQKWKLKKFKHIMVFCCPLLSFLGVISYWWHCREPANPKPLMQYWRPLSLTQAQCNFSWKEPLF